MKTPFKEQETIIRWYREDEEATIYTSDYTMMTRFDKFVESGDWKLDAENYSGQDIVSKEYKAPKNLVFGRSKQIEKRPLTEEEKEAIRMRFKAKSPTDNRENTD